MVVCGHIYSSMRALIQQYEDTYIIVRMKFMAGSQRCRLASDSCALYSISLSLSLSLSLSQSLRCRLASDGCALYSLSLSLTHTQSLRCRLASDGCALYQTVGVTLLDAFPTRLKLYFTSSPQAVGVTLLDAFPTRLKLYLTRIQQRCRTEASDTSSLRPHTLVA